MMRPLSVAGLFLAGILLFSCSQAGAARSQPNTVKRTAAPIWTVAMDGPRVAYGSAGRVYVWNVATGATSVVKGTYSNATHTVNAAEIAIAGRRVAWIKRQQLGNTEQPQKLYTATLGGSAHLLRHVLGYSDTDCGLGGSQISGLVGSGSLLAVSTWKWNYDGTTSTARKLGVITPTRLRTVATGPDAVVAASTDGSRIALVPLRTAVMGPDYCVVTPSEKVSIRSAAGKLLGQVVTGPVSAVALRRDRLVALTQTSTPAVDVYDWTTGAVVRHWPVAAVSRFAPHAVAVYGQLAVYSLGVECRGGTACTQLHLLDLTTGKDVVLATNSYTDHGMALAPRGLVYAVNSYPGARRPHGKLVFVPTAELLRLVSG